MQFAGDSVMAVFGAPFPMADHADRALEAAQGMHAAQAAVNKTWKGQDLEVFDLGIGISTGPVAAALIGSEERLEYTVVGDIVNLDPKAPAVGRGRRDGDQRSDLGAAQREAGQRRVRAQPW